MTIAADAERRKNLTAPLSAASLASVQMRGELTITPADAGERTEIGRAVSENRVQIALSLETILLLIDDKLAALRAERPNSDEAKAALDQEIERYENLKSPVVLLRKASQEFSAGEISEEAVVSATMSFADGLKTWWTKKHVEILDRSFDMAVFTLGIGVCCAAGTGGPIAAAVTGAVLKGQVVVGAIKAALGKSH